MRAMRAGDDPAPPRPVEEVEELLGLELAREEWRMCGFVFECDGRVERREGGRDIMIRAGGGEDVDRAE